MRAIPGLWILLWWVVASCGNDNQVPSGVLPPDKMQELVWDMMRADQFVVSFALPVDSTLQKDKEKIKWYNRVLAIHQVSEKEFKESFAYYQDHPNLMAVIMDSIARKEEKIDVVPNRKGKLVPVQLEE
jgi:hypothetical protein